MIKEVKIALSGNVTPEALANDEAGSVDVAGSYDWNTQSYSYDVYKSGTRNWTSLATMSGMGGYNQDDWNSDSYED